MQKKIIALAIAGLASSAVFADTNVTIYGRIDYGFMNRGGTDGPVTGRASASEFGAGLQSGSRIGFKGVEDLGNGLKALFQMEFGSIKNDQGKGAGDGLSSMRNAYVGLTSKYGTVVGGKLDGVRYGIFNKYDAFGGGNVGNFTQMTAQVDRANNAIAYISPSFAGLTATLAYATHIGDSNPLGLAGDEATTNGNKGDAMLTTAMLNYKNGGLDLTADWERVSFKDGATSGAANSFDDVTVWTVGGSYDFGMVKLAALYDNLQADQRFGGGVVVDVNTWFVSASAPVGKFVLKTTYGQTEDKKASGDVKASKIGVGADYLLSKRTKFYATYGKIYNGDDSKYMLSPAANCTTGAGAVSACSSALGTHGFDVGIAHTF